MRSKTLGINVRVTPEEKEKLLKNAGYCALSLSEYLRRLGLGKDVEATVREKEYRVFRQLKQLKADCEQLETSEISRRIDEILKELRSAEIVCVILASRPFILPKVVTVNLVRAHPNTPQRKEEHDETKNQKTVLAFPAGRQRVKT